ncbi:MAG: alpha/beta hydrolase family protein [Fimbriimonas sp.]
MLPVLLATAVAQAPVNLTAQEDHKRLLRVLGIAALRPGVDGMNPQSPDFANTDEAKANPHPALPDPLVFRDGKPVRNPRDWRRRRGEILEDLDREVYGRTPKRTPKVRWEVVETLRETNGDTPVVTKRLIGHVDNAAYPEVTVDIRMTLSTPAEAKGPVPVMLEFGFPNFGGPRPGGNRPAPPGPTWQQQLLAKGWGYAVIDPSSVQADNGGGLTKGIIGLVNRGQPRGVEDWGALKAWAWGASRALDYFERDRAVDAKRVGIEGLSRYGKAAIVTMAYEPRFAIAFVGSSGQGGAKIWRRNFGETVENVASSGEYHWMAGNYVKYAGPLSPKDFPVDAHQLVALCAPRPVFVGVGSLKVEGIWIDPMGTFMATSLASPVYRLLGRKGLRTTEMPPEGTPLIDGDLAYSQHGGGHTNGPNWPTFIEFASRYFAKDAK